MIDERAENSDFLMKLAKRYAREVLGVRTTEDEIWHSHPKGELYPAFFLAAAARIHYAPSLGIMFPHVYIGAGVKCFNKKWELEFIGEITEMGEDDWEKITVRTDTGQIIEHHAGFTETVYDRYYVLEFTDNLMEVVASENKDSYPQELWDKQIEGPYFEYQYALERANQASVKLGKKIFLVRYDSSSSYGFYPVAVIENGKTDIMSVDNKEK